jgi:DNA/RNA-binding domain of Phe-tRNA-synthetase-like protein
MRHPFTMLNATNEWTRAHQGAMVGLLIVRGAANCGAHDGLQAGKGRIEADLRSRFTAPDLIKSDPVLQAYKAYYKRFGKTYHVAGQVESVAFKGRGLPSVNGLVDAMFMAELKNRLLTAGHDLAACSLPFTVGAAAGTERFTTMRGEEKELKPGDMMISDAAGVISCIIHGPDQRTRITDLTRDAAYFVYAPAGVTEEQVRAHLADIREYVRIFSPEASADAPEIARA